MSPRREPKIKGYDWSGPIMVGGLAIAISAVLPYGTRGGPFFQEQLTAPGSMILGLVVLLVGLIVMLGKRYGGRAVMVGGALGGLVLGGLDVWFRFENMSLLTGESASIGFGLWIAMAGGIAAVIGGLGAIVQAARAGGVREVAEPGPAAGPEWAPTHRVPAGGMPATARPDPSAEIISTLDAGLPVHVLEFRGDWAHVRAENGWEGWVDATMLESLEPSVA